MASRSGTERALIARTVSGSLVVLATDGPWITFECENVCDGAEDIGLVDEKECPDNALYLWTGYAQVENTGPWDEAPEPEVVFYGSVRLVEPNEVADLYAMEAPTAQDH